MNVLGTLRWPVKTSLLAYLAAIGDGEVRLAGGATGNLEDGFSFPVTQRNWPGIGQSGTVAAIGTVTMLGHGMRMFEITDPRIAFRSESAVLSVRRWAGRDALLDIAGFKVTAGSRSKSSWEWPELTLLAAGRELFDHRYEEGAALAPLSLTDDVPA